MDMERPPDDEKPQPKTIGDVNPDLRKAHGWELFRPALQAAAVAGFTAIPLTFVSANVLNDYGLALFLLTPMVLGFIAEAILEWRHRYSIASTVATACLAVVFASVGLMITRIEGLICLLMAMPITLILGVIGTCAARALRTFVDTKMSLVSLAVLLPVAMVVESRAMQTPPELSATTRIVVNAPPERVWPCLVDLRIEQEKDELAFRVGIAAPVATRTAGRDRICELTTGPIVERIVVWDPPRRLRFDVLSTPPPMKELNPFGSVDARHLHGCFLGHAGEFRLTALPGGRSLIEGTSWYSVDMMPLAYWRLWTDYLVHRIHHRVFDAIKRKAEAPGAFK
jgi:hypothetical protein